jgi:hypothetical protein
MTVTNIWNDIDTTLTTPSLSGVDFPTGVQIIEGLTSTWGAVHDGVIAEVASLIEKYPGSTLNYSRAPVDAPKINSTINP